MKKNKRKELNKRKNRIWKAKIVRKKMKKSKRKELKKRQSRI
jgi:hypothetical protein